MACRRFSELKTTKNSIVGNKSTPNFWANGYYYSYGLNGYIKLTKKLNQPLVNIELENQKKKKETKRSKRKQTDGI